MLVCELSACDADRNVGQLVDRSGRDGRAAMGVIVGLVAALLGCRVWLGSQGRVGPGQLVGLRGRAPGQVLVTGLGKQVVAGVF